MNKKLKKFSDFNLRNEFFWMQTYFFHNFLTNKPLGKFNLLSTQQNGKNEKSPTNTDKNKHIYKDLLYQLLFKG